MVAIKHATSKTGKLAWTSQESHASDKIHHEANMNSKQMRFDILNCCVGWIGHVAPYAQTPHGFLCWFHPFPPKRMPWGRF